MTVVLMILATFAGWMLIKYLTPLAFKHLTPLALVGVAWGVYSIPWHGLLVVLAVGGGVMIVNAVLSFLGLTVPAWDVDWSAFRPSLPRRKTRTQPLEAPSKTTRRRTPTL